jgi:hypothetical protein
MARMRTLPTAREELAAKANTSSLLGRDPRSHRHSGKSVPSSLALLCRLRPDHKKNQADHPTNSLNPNKKRCSCLRLQLVNSSSTSSRASRHRHQRLEASQDSPRHEPWRPPSLRRHGTTFRRRRHHHHGSPPRTDRLVSITSSSNTITSAGTSRLRRRPSRPSN